MSSIGEMWGKAVKYCEEHYANCYTCGIRGACWEERRDKSRPRTAAEYKEQICAAMVQLGGSDFQKEQKRR